MFRAIYILTLAALLLTPPVVLAEPPPEPAGTIPGRFVIITTQHRTPPNYNPEPVTIRLDTATGRTWQLADAPILLSSNQVTYVTGWIEISEDPFTFAKQTNQEIANLKTKSASKPPIDYSKPFWQN